jgi:hypothetical protein
MDRLLRMAAVLSGLAGAVVILQFFGIPDFQQIFHRLGTGSDVSVHADCPDKPAQLFIFPDSDTRVLHKEDLIGLPGYKLRIARNEIYARHGLRFKTDMKVYFACQPWYRPSVDDATNLLSPVEHSNVDFILAAEKH